MEVATPERQPVGFEDSFREASADYETLDKRYGALLADAAATVRELREALERSARKAEQLDYQRQVAEQELNQRAERLLRSEEGRAALEARLREREELVSRQEQALLELNRRLSSPLSLCRRLVGSLRDSARRAAQSLAGR